MKNIVRVLIPVLMVILLALTAFAADSTVTWNGMDKGFAFAPGSNYTTTDLFDNFKMVMPGDVRTEVVTVSNRADDSDYIKIYMRTDTHDDPETQMFLSALSIKVSNGGNVLFEGFADVTEPILLGKLLPDESLKLDVTLTAPLSLGNEYSGKIGEVDWIFLVEAFDEPTPPPVVKQQLTVRKVWDDDGIDRPEQVTVALLREGSVAETVVLNQENHWIYTWSELDDDAVWSVEETNVPDGYTESYTTEGSTVTIINKKDPPPPPVTHTVTARKVWSDTGLRRPTQITVDLLRNGIVDRSVVLNEANSWEYTWTGLEDGAIWTVAESAVPSGYTVSYHTEDTLTIITNTEIPSPPPPPPPVSYESLTVEKVWEDDGSVRPQNVEIALLRNGERVNTVMLSGENNWKHTFTMLEENAGWSVEEVSVPAGYEVSYIVDGNCVTVVNTQIPVVVPVEYISMTVIKEWDDDGSIRPQSVEIALLRNGVTAETVILNEDNAWRYTWSTLSADAVWTVSEPVVPKDYVVTYRTEGNTVTVINKQILDEINPQDPLDVPDKISLTVVKTWDDAHYPDAKRPEGVKMTLYNGEEAVESVWLGAWNHWTFTWSDLDSKGEWSVMEEPVEGYTPYYSVSGDTVTVTNTAILLQTGQLKWPIPVIAGCGLLLIGIGILLLSSKKEKNHAS